MQNWNRNIGQDDSHRFRHRQPGERCRGPGHSESESDARVRRGSRAVFETGAVMGITTIKIGGALLEKPDAAVARILAAGATKFAVVHGGGVQITRMLEKRNVKSEFIDGLRVTDSAALGCVAAALLGE